MVHEDFPDINTANEAGMDEFLDFFDGQAPQYGNKDAAAQWTVRTSSYSL